MKITPAQRTNQNFGSSFGFVSKRITLSEQMRITRALLEIFPLTDTSKILAIKSVFKDRKTFVMTFPEDSSRQVTKLLEFLRRPENRRIPFLYSEKSDYEGVIRKLEQTV